MRKTIRAATVAAVIGAGLAIGAPASAAPSAGAPVAATVSAPSVTTDGGWGRGRGGFTRPTPFGFRRGGFNRPTPFGWGFRHRGFWGPRVTPFFGGFRGGFDGCEVFLEIGDIESYLLCRTG